MAASIQSGELVAELEKPEPLWPPKAGSTRGSSDDEEEETPYVISRKWVADFKTYYDQVRGCRECSARIGIKFTGHRAPAFHSSC